MLKKEFGDLRSLDFIRLQAIKKLSEVLIIVTAIYVNTRKVKINSPRAVKESV